MNTDHSAYEPASRSDRLRAVLELAPFEDEELSEEEQAALNELDRLRNEDTVDNEEIRTP